MFEASLKYFRTLIPAVLNSYSVVFFFNNRLFAFVLLIVSFFNVFAGFCGLAAVFFTVIVANSMGYDKLKLKQGIYSFNALLTGIAMGTFFEAGPAFFVLLMLAVLFSLITSVMLSGWLGKYGLPFLSIPFVISFWLILFPSGQLANLGLNQRNIFWMNEMYAIGGKHLLDFFQTIDNIPLSRMLVVYLRSLSSIIFQDNLITGILIAAALLISSRIAFLLSLTGFITAYLFAHLIGSDIAGFSFYNIGANYILVAIAAGGFFTIPSRYSFLWVVILVPLTSLIILFMTKLGVYIQLPFFSLPFSIVVISFTYFLILRVKPGKLILTTFQNYSPEINLYTYKGSVDRITGHQFFPLHLPFWGEWTVSQGHEGMHTHKGEWSSAVDFVLVDERNKTYGASTGTCDDYFCYNKPVVAPADGVIAEIIDNIDDNEPGKVNTSQNWGNTIIIKHLNDLYTQMSHLKAGSLRVYSGDYVKKGDIIALCGNSGRSPEPHLHFQVQLTPLPGAKTLSYPFSYYLQNSSNGMQLCSFRIPLEGETISNVLSNTLLKTAYDFQPGMILKFKYVMKEAVEKEITWEVFTDSYNYRYIFCTETQSAAYFVNDGTMFYFTYFTGDHKSLLYYFYLTSYKVLLGIYPNIEVSDIVPLNIIRKNRISLWMHDFIAPFYQYIKVNYSIKPAWSDSSVNPEKIKLASKLEISRFSSVQDAGAGTILLSDSKLCEFSFESNNIKVWAQRADM
jgi:urea transporter/murein DD-endopeptidase MepM/ murein hydrolase activator NlpD